MAILVDLPQTSEQLIAHEAERIGVSPSEQAAFLLQIMTALLPDGRMTRFRRAVKELLAENSVDADRLGEVVEKMVKVGLQSANIPSKSSDLLHIEINAMRELIAHQDQLWLWRSNEANQPIDDMSIPQHEQPFPVDPSHGIVPRKDRVSALGKFAYLGLTTEAFMAEKQLEIDREDRPR